MIKTKKGSNYRPLLYTHDLAKVYGSRFSNSQYIRVLIFLVSSQKTRYFVYHHNNKYLKKILKIKFFMYLCLNSNLKNNSYARFYTR